MNNLIFILNKNGVPLTPFIRLGKIKHMLKRGEAKIYSHEPFFTIQLLTDDVESFSQPLTLGIDAGYSSIGFSVINKQGKEIIGGELELRNDIRGLIVDKSMYRTQRKGKKRYREPRFDNRGRKTGSVIENKWLPPSIEHKVNTHIKIINLLCKILSIKKINIELANFDIQKIINPDISGTGYQEGIQHGFWNLREAVIFRDGHKCQNPNCKNKDKNPILKVHHIVFRGGKFGGTDTPTNLITLCNKCHTPTNHKPGKFLHQWMLDNKKATKNFKDSTFMNILRWNILNKLKETYPNLKINMKFGYETKSKRIQNKIEKTHHHDAFVIAGGTSNEFITEPILLKIERRNNRSLGTFRDAKYIDVRDGKVKSGQELSCGRSTRNKEKNGENLRVYREIILGKDGKRKPITIGKNSIRKEISKFPKVL